MYIYKLKKIILVRIITIILIGGLILPDAALSMTSPLTSTLAVQSMFKLMVSLAKVDDRFEIFEDEETLGKIQEGFQKDAEIQYFDLLKERAREIGLSRNGLKILIKEHLDEINFVSSEKSHLESLQQDEKVPGSKETANTINRAPADEDQAAKTTIKQEPNLWLNPYVVEVEKELKVNGLENFTHCVKIPQIIGKAEIGKVPDNRIYGIYEHKNGIQVIRKHVDHIEDIKEFLSSKHPSVCPSFFARGDNEHVYELNLLQFGYRSLREKGPLTTMNNNQKARDFVKKAIFDIFKNDSRGFIHGHLHRGNILARRNVDDEIEDIKVIDWKYIRKIPIEDFNSISGGFSYNKNDNLLGKRIAGSHRVELLNIENKDLSKLKYKKIFLHWIFANNVSLSGVKFYRTTFAWSEFVNSDFSNISARKLFIQESDLRNSNFNHASIKGSLSFMFWFRGLVEFLKHKLTELKEYIKNDFKKPEPTPAEHPIFKPKKPKFWLKSTFLECDLRGASFNDSSLSRVLFGHSDLRNASFTNSKIDNTIFRDSDLANADFRGIKGVNWGGKGPRIIIWRKDHNDIWQERIENNDSWINVFYGSNFDDTKFDIDKGKFFEEEGFTVRYFPERNYCLVTRNIKKTIRYRKDISDDEKPTPAIEMPGTKQHHDPSEGKTNKSEPELKEETRENTSVAEMLIRVEEIINYRNSPETERPLNENNGSGQLIKFKAEKLLVVGDLHTDLQAFDKIMDTVLEKELEEGKTKIILTGDLLTGINREDYFALHPKDNEQDFEKYKEEESERAYKLLIKVTDLMDRYPRKVFMLSGNSELAFLYGVGGERTELAKSLMDEDGRIRPGKEKLFEAIKSLIDNMPLFAIVEIGARKYFISHGGMTLEEMTEEKLINFARDGIDAATFKDKLWHGEPGHRGNDINRFMGYCYHFIDKTPEMIKKMQQAARGLCKTLGVDGQILGHVHLVVKREMNMLGVRRGKIEEADIPYGVALDGKMHFISSFSDKGHCGFLEVTGDAEKPVKAKIVKDEKESASEHLWGQTFIDIALMRAYEARRLYVEGKIESPDILIGAETSWIPKEQRPYIQGLLNKLSRLSKEKGLDNLIIKRKEGTRLASILRKEAGERGIPNSNVIILGDHNVLEAGAFDSFREGIDPEKWAFFAGVELPENFPENNYIRLLEMLTNALNLWSGKPRPADTPFMRIVQEGKRIYKFIIPEVEPMDYNLLKEIYAGQLKSMKSA